MTTNQACYISREGKVRVTNTEISTRRHLIAIADVQSIEMRRPYAVHGCVTGGGLMLLCTVFWTELAAIDRAVFSSVAAISALTAFQVGTLKVSFAFRDVTIHGPYGRLLQLRRGIERALLQRFSEKKSLTSTHN